MGKKLNLFLCVSQDLIKKIFNVSHKRWTSPEYSPIQETSAVAKI